MIRRRDRRTLFNDFHEPAETYLNIRLIIAERFTIVLVNQLSIAADVTASAFSWNFSLARDRGLLISIDSSKMTRDFLPRVSPSSAQKSPRSPAGDSV